MYKSNFFLFFVFLSCFSKTSHSFVLLVFLVGGDLKKGKIIKRVPGFALS